MRKALEEPLNDLMLSMSAEANTPRGIEGAIGDEAFEFVRKMQRTGREVLQFPQEPLEVLLNIFFNQEYNLNDAPF